MFATLPLWADAPTSSPPAPAEARPPRYGLSVYRSAVALSPYEYDQVVRSPVAQRGPLRQNRETAYPFSFWYYNDGSRLLFEIASSHVVLRQARYKSTYVYSSTDGGRGVASQDYLLPTVSRSVQTAQVLRPWQLWSTRLLLGGGLRSMLREESAFNGVTSDYNRTRMLAAQGVVRWEIPLTAMFGLEVEALGYAGPGRYERAPYTYVSWDQTYASTLVYPRQVGAHLFGVEGGLRLRCRLDENLSLSLGYQQGFESRRLDHAQAYYWNTTAGGNPFATLSLSTPGAGRRYDERVYSYSLGLTLQM